jgi:pre-rRNA-processing protein TSR3
MQTFPPTVVVRHRKENLKKCSLRGLEQREDFLFFTYPRDPLPLLENYILLAMEGPELTEQECAQGLVIIDATWRYAAQMLKAVEQQQVFEKRTLPGTLRTAYPRRQSDCPDPERGLASIEAIYASYKILGRDCSGLLDNYYWREAFLEKAYPAGGQ